MKMIPLWFAVAVCAAAVALIPRVRSSAAGLLDPLFAVLTLKKRSFFFQGPGDVDKFRSILLKLKPYSYGVPQNVTLEEWKASGEALCAMGSFESPVSADLPEVESIRTVRFQIVVPKQGFEAALRANMPFVVHLPATGDEGFGRRREMIAKPLLQRGVASIILQIPFYGQRRFPGQTGPGLMFLQHISEQSLGATMEAIALASWIKTLTSNQAPIGFTGVSYGGAMAALASVLCPFDNATATLVPSHGPAPPFVEGMLSLSVNHGAFSGGVQEVTQLLSEMDITALSVDTTIAAQVRRVYLQLTAKDDYYIPLYSADKLAKAVLGLPNTTGELRYINGGHVSSFIFQFKQYSSVIAEAFETLARAEAKRKDD